MLHSTLGAGRTASKGAARHVVRRRVLPGGMLPAAVVHSRDGAMCCTSTTRSLRRAVAAQYLQESLVAQSRHTNPARVEAALWASPSRRGLKRRLGERWLHSGGQGGDPPPKEKEAEQRPPPKEDKVQDGPGSAARESVWTTPNMITMTRILCSPVLSWFILHDEYEKALAGVLVAAFTDWLDGYIAKNYNQTSILGTFLDPLADKVLVAALALPLAYQGHLPAPLLGIWLGRDLLLVTGSFVKRAMSRPEGSPFFDTTSTATFKIMPSNLSKFNTALQFTVLSMSVSRAMWGIPGPEIFEPLCWLVGGTTIASGLTYLAGDGTGLLKKRKGIKK